MINRKKLVTEMGRIGREAFIESEKLPLVVVLDNVRSLHNVGSVFRTSDAFRDTIHGYEGVMLENMSMNVANGSYKYALYPVWLLNTSWNGEKFTFAMNGQTGKFVGNIPTDKKAVTKASLLLGAGIGAVIYGLMWLIELL